MKGIKPARGSVALVQLVPLKDLNVGFLEVKTARQHARDVSIAFHTGRAAEQFDDTSIFVVLDGVFRLRDKVGVVFSAHGDRAYDSGLKQSVSNYSVGCNPFRTNSRPVYAA
jgi:hypothetical protein